MVLFCIKLSSEMYIYILFELLLVVCKVPIKLIDTVIQFIKNYNKNYKKIYKKDSLVQDIINVIKISTTICDCPVL